MKIDRLRVKIGGLVQGVGFRPFLYNLAKQHGLTGWVRNNFAGVEVEVQGETHSLSCFIEEIKIKAPSAAEIDLFETEQIAVLPEVKREDGFAIIASEPGEMLGAPLPDQGLCELCQGELFDPHNRRFHHPFNSCTICGPRFTIISALPFDRSRTTMDEFNLCPACKSEYTNPLDRRFHAQTIACPECGPKLEAVDPAGNLREGNPAEQTLRLLKSGGIVAIKGIGGYHLACNAFDDQAVIRLRRLKGRDNRAFAVMFKDLSEIRANCSVNPEEERVLESPARPILLLKQKTDSLIAKAVNPGLKELGVFLPYTGIQLLLFDMDVTALVMTSGNRSGEPLTVDDAKAVGDLGLMTDGILRHNRTILWPCDDSVIRVQKGKLIGIRRSRGYVPAPVKVNRELVPLLACGPQQKNTFALTKDNQVFLSSHQGDLDNLATFLSYRETVKRFTRLLHCEPEWVAHDLHPGYNSTIYAQDSNLKKIGVQHHLAHIAAVIAAGQITGPVIGVSFDGSGYGTDGKIWGGEFFAGEGCVWQRMGHLKYHPLPGGEAAITEPWRMGAIYADAVNPEFLSEWFAGTELMPKWTQLKTAVKYGINAPETSSMGRLFDGVAALAGRIFSVSYEGEAAVWLENVADESITDRYEYEINKIDGVYQVDPGIMIGQIFEDYKQSLSTGVISMKFHRTIAFLIGEMTKMIHEVTGYTQVVLSGGVFQNRLLLDLAWETLEKEGFRVVVPEIIPVNDGGIALGQAWLGSLMIERGVNNVPGSSR